ncbi:MAG: bifunctional metallophosphatase/5'-nucleotidase [Proteobacteria bacterium]|nr:bifunctional metallophosphatase/5'-nucleotidase [Pseudomonadota bacterium]
MTQHLTLLQLNDLHGYLEPHPEVFRNQQGSYYATAGGIARIATLFRQVRAQRPGAVIALDNGDTFHGTFAAVDSRGMALVPVMNGLGLDAMTAHWEFAYGPEHFRALARQLAHPVLAINCYGEDSGRPVFEPSRVLERGRLRVGLIGIAASIVDKTMPRSYSQGLRFTLGTEELPRRIEQLRREDKVDLIVVLSHLGLPQDVKLAGDISGIDVLVSGHTHNRLSRPIRVDRTLIFQSGCHGSFIGRLDLEVDGRGVTGFEHALIPVGPQIPEDPEMALMVRQIMAPHRQKLAEVVGRTERALDRAAVLEGSMDEVLLDSIAQAAQTRLAFSNGWRYGAPILPGEVTVEQLWNIVPTNAPVSVVELTGEELLGMLEENLERTFAANPYEQMGGFVKRCRDLHLYFKVENPAGHRIEQLFVEGEPLALGRRYRAALLGEQAVPAKYGAQREHTGIRAVDALRAHFRSAARSRGARAHSVTAI